jgi:hypothetical protein
MNHLSTAERQTPSTKVVLSGSNGSGEALRFHTNRNYLARAINLGFREFYLYGTEVPVQGRDANRVYVWAVLGEDGVIKPSKDAIRIESLDASQQPSADSKPRTMRIRKTMSSSKQSTNAQSSVRGDANGKSDTAGIAALIEQAETVKTSLSTALTETKQLVAALKKHRQQSKALQSTLASLRQLQSVEL